MNIATIILLLVIFISLSALFAWQILVFDNFIPNEQAGPATVLISFLLTYALAWVLDSVFGGNLTDAVVILFRRIWVGLLVAIVLYTVVVLWVQRRPGRVRFV